MHARSGAAAEKRLVFAAECQRILQPAYRKAREWIDELSRDFVLIFGDDPYEVIKDDWIYFAVRHG